MNIQIVFERYDIDVIGQLQSGNDEPVTIHSIRQALQDSYERSMIKDIRTIITNLQKEVPHGKLNQ
jgi:hypothetical protein